jgi:hypothetical protein
VGPSRTISTAKYQPEDRASTIKNDTWNVGRVALSMIEGAIEPNAHGGGRVFHVSGSSVIATMVAVRCVVAPPR